MAKPLLTLLSDDEAHTARIAAAVANTCSPGDCLRLTGDLGAGKTAFARGFIQALCGKAEEVLSPTFTLMQNYPTPAGWPVCHFDLYRLKSAQELDQLGLDDALASGVTLIEWPEIAADMLPASALTIAFQTENETTRTLVFSGDALVWQARMEGMA